MIAHLGAASRQAQFGGIGIRASPERGQAGLDEGVYGERADDLIG